MFEDFKELLSEFNAHQVKYLIVGGYAVSFHAEPRATKDLHIVISADPENSKAVYAALAKFGAPVEGLSPKDFAEPDGFFRMGTPPVMVDILPRISGVDFDDAWQRRVIVQIDDTLIVPFISRQDLLAAKIAAGRAQDLADVAALEIGEAEQPRLPAGGLQAIEEIRQAQARGREDWLEQRRRQVAESATPAPDRSHDQQQNYDVTRDTGDGIGDDGA